MTLRPRANEIPDLIGRLGSRSEARIDAARARLAIIGGRAVEGLIEALEGGSRRVRTHAMPLLALIGDPRGREPLVAMLRDRDPRMRAIAAKALSRFPSPEVACALTRLAADREQPDEVRVAAVRAAIDQYAAGQEQTVGSILEHLHDSGEREAVRLGAFSILRHLDGSQRRTMLAALRRDANDAVVEKARRYGAPNQPPPEDRDPVEVLLEDLGEDDYGRWNAAVHRLIKHGRKVVVPLVEAMQSRSHDPEYCTRAGMVLKALGPRRAKALAELIETVDEPLPLQVLVEVIGALGEKSMIYGLKDLIDRIAERPQGATELTGFDMMQRVRAKAHLELARIGSRVAIQDLRDALADRDRRVELEMLAAVEVIGKRDELLDLLRAWPREDRYMRERIAEVVRTIMKRERIRRNNKMFQSLAGEPRRAFEAICPQTARQTARRAPVPRPAP